MICRMLGTKPRPLIATLKDDPDLLRLEQEAEEAISELSAGDEKVKQTLGQLIESHHDKGHAFAEGMGGAAGDTHSGEELGFKTVKKDGVVFFCCRRTRARRLTTQCWLYHRRLGTLRHSLPSRSLRSSPASSAAISALRRRPSARSLEPPIAASRPTECGSCKRTITPDRCDGCQLVASAPPCEPLSPGKLLKYLILLVQLGGLEPPTS